MRPVLDAVPHGTERGYRKGCGCTPCRDAHRVEMRRQREERFRRPREAVPHGYSGYQNYGCRCDVCSWAYNTRESRPDRVKYKREHRASRRLVGAGAS